MGGEFMRCTSLLCIFGASCWLWCTPAWAYPLAAEIEATGRADPRLVSFDRLMTDFLQEHELPGAALAVARNGQLVYARGFGYADRAANEPVRPGALFRIASLSKPLTAVA